ncbi:hypothetical protein IE53DRAFT_398195 [Violaceomyces palustris]|uniref:Uncharacterized protein n=1 Tax=Violaceomyces palustris TaxID=1673888 RepID=A0ACD0P8J9_9BASI|nr:hypothetical protein IE53DRAFT_398195 [Violaceomyces palustris]
MALYPSSQPVVHLDESRLQAPRAFSEIFLGPASFYDPIDDRPSLRLSASQRPLQPRPTLEAFLVYLVVVFDRECRAGRLGHSWDQIVQIASKEWPKLGWEQLEKLDRAVARERENLAANQVQPPQSDTLPHIPERHDSEALSGYQLFVLDPQTRVRIHSAAEPRRYPDFHSGKAFVEAWFELEEEERQGWRRKAKERVEKMGRSEEEIASEPKPIPNPGNSSQGKRKLLGPALGAREEEDESHQKQEASKNSKPEGKDEEDEEAILSKMPANLHRWDSYPYPARNARCLFYSLSLAPGSSPLAGKNPHSPVTRGLLSDEWERLRGEEREKYEKMALEEEKEHRRQLEEHQAWIRAWGSFPDWKEMKNRFKDRWRPLSSFDADQNRPVPLFARKPSPRAGSVRGGGSDVGEGEDDLQLSEEFYPCFRTCYEEGSQASYNHIRRTLEFGDFFGQIVHPTLQFYDGLPISSQAEEAFDARGDLHPPHGDDFEWCRDSFSGLSPEELVQTFGDLDFDPSGRPLYRLGPHHREHLVVVDQRSLRDGTVILFSTAEALTDYSVWKDGLSDRGELDPSRKWAVMPRFLAADVPITLCNLDIANVSWFESVETRVVDGEHRPVHPAVAGLGDGEVDLLKNEDQRLYEGFRLVIEYTFGPHALDHVVGERLRLDNFADLMQCK